MQDIFANIAKGFIISTKLDVCKDFDEENRQKMHTIEKP